MTDQPSENDVPFGDIMRAHGPWQDDANKLATWALTHLANRTDCFIRYRVDGGQIRARRESEKGRPCLYYGTFVEHFEARQTSKFVGLHALDADSRGKWVGILFSNTDDPNKADLDLCEQFALAVYADLSQLGFTPLLESKCRPGDPPRLWVPFTSPVESTTLFAFGNWLVRNHAAYGFTSPPAVFPRWPAARSDQDENRNAMPAPGRALASDHWPDVWNGSDWLRGGSAVKHLLGIKASPETLIPAEAVGYVPPERLHLPATDSVPPSGHPAEEPTPSQGGSAKEPEAGPTEDTAEVEPTGSSAAVREDKPATSIPDQLAKLLPQHLADLRNSGLSDEQIAACKFQSHTDGDAAARFLKWKGHGVGVVPCLVIPYLDWNGKHIKGYARLKPDKVIEFSDGGTAKYLTPKGSAPRGYIPPNTRQFKNETGTPLIIVEGEKKAAKADQDGFPAIGISGVWSWTKKRQDEAGPREMVDELKAVNWKGRRTIIVFDSDIIHKPQIQAAAFQLSNVLKEAGADVVLVILPDLPDGKKCGLDDYLIHNTRDSFKDLLSTAGPVPHPANGKFRNFDEVEIIEDDEPKIVQVSRSPAVMLAEVAAKTKETGLRCPVAITGKLYATSGPRSLALAGSTPFFAWLSRTFEANGRNRIEWAKGDQMMTKEEFHAYCVQNAPQFHAISDIPHIPPIPDVFYTPCKLAGGDLTAFEKLLGMFRPASLTDLSLLMAVFMTPMWGGPPGKRPIFLFEAEPTVDKSGRGVGKSTMARFLPRLYGGCFEIRKTETFPDMLSRMVSTKGKPDLKRIALFDNVKTLRFSWDELEGLITSPTINGWELYGGDGERPNLYTFIVTLNGASLSNTALSLQQGSEALDVFPCHPLAEGLTPQPVADHPMHGR